MSTGYIQFSTYQPKNMYNPLFPKFKQRTGPNNFFSMSSVFSDNSQVYYKPHTLASGGVGTVKNHRRKWKHT